MEGIALWRYCLIRPSEGSSPVDALVGGLLSETALPELAAVGTAMELAEAFRATPEKAQAPIRSALGTAAKAAHVGPRLARLVIAVDQMEELFTAAGTDRGARKGFVRLLAAMADSGFVWVVGTVRADFFRRCGEVPGFSALKDGHRCGRVEPAGAGPSPLAERPSVSDAPSGLGQHLSREQRSVR